MKLLLVPVLLACRVAADARDWSSSNVEEEPSVAQDNDTDVVNGRTLLLLGLLKHKLHSKLHALDRITTTPLPFSGCLCVPFYLCDASGSIINDGAGIIDQRLGYRRCTGDLEVCCFLRAPTTRPPVVMIPMTQPPIVTIPMTIPTTRPPVMTIPTTIPTTRPPVMTIPTTIPTTRPPVVTIPTTIPTTRPPVTTIPTTIPTTRPPVVTIPTTIPTTRPPVVTIPTTPPTTAMTTRPSLPVSLPYVNCVCVPVFQCAIYGGDGTGTGLVNPRQQYNPCYGAYVCCTNVPGFVTAPYQPVTFPPFTLPTTRPPTQPPVVTTAPVPVTLPPIVIGQSCVCTLINSCNLGYIPMSQVGSLDPRLILGRQGQPAGTCSGTNSMCCRLAQDNQPPAILSNINSQVDIKNPGTPNACRCVLEAECPDGNAVTYDGVGIIDPRFGPCASATLVCCRLNLQRSDPISAVPATSKPTIANPASIIVSAPTQICGTRDTTYVNTASGSEGATYFGEFPWMTLLLIRKAGTNDVLQCGGSLINSRTVLTAAHCVVSCDPGTLIARLGEWNTANTNEPLPFQEAPVWRILVHPQYNSGGLYNDVALVILATSISYTASVRPVCLPAQTQVFAPGTICYATGWGRSAFSADGQYQSILRKVDLPIIDNASCQTRLRATRLGQSFQLHPSFICAGGQMNKDTCYKDGGGPFVCQDPSSGRFTQVGIISWGIGCGTNTPGVYADVVQYRQWIDQQLQLNGVSS